ncbi:MAG: GNAT family N-acetyltransferase [Alphaproteobacteria bacterium]|nr:GNAT family N-acetyltransferase [Alphaproteobacteria bacterium]
MRFEPVQTDDDRLNAYVALFRICFPDAQQYNLPFLRWMYRENPEGHAFGFDAVANGRIAAHFVGLPARTMTAGAERRALLILNVATHPDHRRKGLFAELANRTRTAAAQAGFDLLFGVANAQTIPGYRLKLGYQDVGGLDARLGVGRVPPIDWPAALAAARFFRVWTPQALQWRLRNPANPVDAWTLGDGVTAFAAATHYPGIRAYAERGDAGHVTSATQPGRASFARVFVGAVPTGARRPGLSVAIPHALRPSPLRLIFLDLHRPEYRLNGDEVLFSFLDFDAF